MLSESQVSPITTDLLIKKINQSAAFYKSEPQGDSFSPNAELPAELPELATDMSGMKEWIGYIEGFLQTARNRAEVRNQWPDALNRFPFVLLKPLQSLFFKFLTLIFKDQREVNLNLIEVSQQSLRLNQELMEQLATFRSQVHGLNRRGEEMARILGTADRGLNDLRSQVRSGERRLDGSEGRLKASEKRLDRSEGNLDRQQMALDKVEEFFKTVDRRNFRDISFLKNDLTQQKRLLANFLEEVKKSLPETLPPEKLQELVREEEHDLDAFYVAFEDQFRGSREYIYDRFKVYLPLLATANIGTPQTPILDIGCGRGEWLELLQQSHYMARGLDLNRVMVEECCDRGLDVREADAISYFRSLPDGCLGGVTGFHIIEHLPFPDLMSLFQEAYRVLCPGGIVIFETPNPSNVMVGSCNFYLDPTHRNPLPSPLSKFLAEFTGFEKVEVLNLHPWTEMTRLTGSELATRFSDCFYGPQDYAVIGYKL